MTLRLALKILIKRNCLWQIYTNRLVQELLVLHVGLLHLADHSHHAVQRVLVVLAVPEDLVHHAVRVFQLVQADLAPLVVPHLPSNQVHHAVLGVPVLPIIFIFQSMKSTNTILYYVINLYSELYNQLACDPGVPGCPLGPGCPFSPLGPGDPGDPSRPG